MSASVRSSAVQILSVNISTPAFKAEAYGYYARLRLEAPVHPVKLPTGRTAWLVSRYDDVQALLKDERLVKNIQNAESAKPPLVLPGFLGAVQALQRNMLDLDAPDHTRLRGLVHQAFTPRLIERMRGRVQTLADELLHKARGKGSFELIQDYALPIPLTVISEMLGIPAQDQLRFHRWINRAMTVTTAAGGLLALPAILNSVRFLRRIIEARRAVPQDDLISGLVQAEDSGQKLSADETVAMVFLLLTAGHETTVNLIGNGTFALLQNPEQLDRLRSEPTLYKTAIEELARFYSPVELATERYTREATEIAGVTIPKGQLVYGVLASANRDENQFERPNTLDLGREKNRHLAYGQGIHYCLGAPLARLEAQVAFQTLLTQIPKLRLAVPAEQIEWRRGIQLRGLAKLPLVF